MEKEQSLCKEKKRVELHEPKHYKVILHNDDFTTMDIVFFKSQEEAEALMLKVHQQQSATAGVYSYDVAQSKAQKATQMAREEGFPLRLTVEPEDN